MNELRTATSADRNIRVPDRQEQIALAGLGQWGGHICRKMALAVNTLEPTGFPGIGKKSEISDSCKAFRKNMGKEPVNEFYCRKRYRLLFPGFTVCYGECDDFSVISLNSAVGDSRAEGIPGQVLNGIAVPVKGFDNLSNPFHLIKPVAESSPAVGIGIGISVREDQEILSPEPFNSFHHFSPEQFRQRRYRQEKASFNFRLFLPISG